MPDIFDQLAPQFQQTGPKPAAQSLASATPAQSNPGQTQSSGDIFDQIANGSGADPWTTPVATQPSIGKRALQGVGESLSGAIAPVKAMTAPPTSAHEELALTLGGVPALSIYRAGKAVVDATERMVQSPGEKYAQAKQDFVRAVNDFSKRDYRNMASDVASLSSDNPMLGPVGERFHELSEGARPGGNFVQPLARDAMDAVLFSAGEAAPYLTEYAPKSLTEIMQGEGKARPFNVFEGPINKSVGASKADVTYGNPSQALVDEGINTPLANGRLAATNAKLNELRPQLNAKLAAAGKPIPLDQTFYPTLKNASDKIENAALSPAEKLTAHQELQTLADRIYKFADPLNNNEISAVEANEAKQAIGDSVKSWSKRAQIPHTTIEDAARNLYGNLKDAVNEAADTAELNRRFTNLIALKESLIEHIKGLKLGNKGIAEAQITRPAALAKEIIGDVAPGGIRTAQRAASIAQPATRISLAADEANKLNGTGNPGQTQNPQ